MIRLIAQIVKLPVSAFVASCELFTGTMRAWQQAFECGLDTVARGFVQLGPAAEESPDSPPQDASASNPIDRDLGGDDLKLVKYRILQTRRDRESVLEVREAIVNYPTTVTDYSGRIICEYIKRHPELVKDPDNEKYIRTFVQVIERYPRQAKEYDKDQIEVLREIRDKM